MTNKMLTESKNCKKIDVGDDNVERIATSRKMVVIRQTRSIVTAALVLQISRLTVNEMTTNSKSLTKQRVIKNKSSLLHDHN